MPTCICKNGHVSHWENTRGSHMPETCRTCQQPNILARWEYPTEADRGQYVPIEPRHTKREKVTCPVCGKSRYVPGANVRSYPNPVTVEGAWIKEDDKWVRSAHLIEPGQYVCWFHDLVTPKA